MSSWKERVEQHVAQEVLVAEAKKTKEEELRKIAKEARRVAEEKAASQEAIIASRRLELAKGIMEQWDAIGVPQILEEINTDIWKKYGKHTESNKKEGDIVTQRTHELTANRIVYINEKWRDVEGWRFGKHKTVIFRGLSFDGDRIESIYESRGFHKKKVAKELVGYDLNESKSQLGVSLWTGGGGSDNGWINAYDTSYKLDLPEYDFDVSRDKKSAGTGLRLSFNQGEFDIDNARVLLDSFFLASSVARDGDFVSGMRSDEEELRSVRNRIGETRSV